MNGQVEANSVDAEQTAPWEQSDLVYTVCQPARTYLIKFPDENLGIPNLR